MRVIERNSFTLSGSRWLWLFPAAYFLHIIEELWGVEAMSGNHLSRTKFIGLSSAAWLLMVIGLVLAQRFGFPQMLAVCLSTIFVVNGLSHLVHSLMMAGYATGVFTGTAILIPLGLATLIGLRHSMRRRRYLAGIALGIIIHGVVTALTIV
ncbi:MAG TPA: HXXEE domain-containing protein [Pyrinomonadaceae bacterium]|jgi:hypothetical protein